MNKYRAKKNFLIKIMPPSCVYQKKCVILQSQVAKVTNKGEIVCQN